ncbi:MAG: 4Fe-4S ferredoxin, partial [Bacteroidetes bacterium]|nr:4Fe-4S ferredoxin [Bacteroidota bacterium]
MCEFCSKHGEGKIWYKNASNYSQDLLSDLRRRKFIEQFLDVTIAEGFKSLLRLEAIIKKRGGLPEPVIKKMLENAKIEHYGQVLPIEEVREVIDRTIDIVRLPCACRWTIDKSDLRCCYGITYHPEAWHKSLDLSYFGQPESDLLDSVSKETAIRQMEDIEHKGAIHTIWTFITPFIGAICN